MTQCCYCSSLTAHLVLFPCGHPFHVRCLFPWPIRECIKCNITVEAIRLISPNCYLHTTNISQPNIEILQYFGLQRAGRWLPEEMIYVSALRDAFCSGTLPLSSDSRLPNFLAHMLQCSSKRLRGKFKTGKQVYHAKKICSITHAELSQIYRSYMQISELEDSFIREIASRSVAVSSSFLTLQATKSDVSCIGSSNYYVSNSSILATTVHPPLSRQLCHLR